MHRGIAQRRIWDAEIKGIIKHVLVDRGMWFSNKSVALGQRLAEKFGGAIITNCHQTIRAQSQAKKKL